MDKALTFTPKLADWVLATTGKKDAAIEEVARHITKEHQAKGLFPVQVMAWEDLQALMAQHPAVIAEFYPEHTPIEHRIEIAIAHLTNSIPTPQFGSVRKAVEEELASFASLQQTHNAIDLQIKFETDDGRRSTSQLEIAAALLEGKTIILEAEPGAGKSTTLVQIAEAICHQAPTAIPIVTPVIELSKSDVPIWDDIFARPRFHGLAKDELLRLANDGALVFLFDGWNELLEAQRIRLLTEFKKLRRSFPKCGLLIATRAIAPLLLMDARKAFVSALTRAQQLEILSRILGDPAAAESLLTRARRTPGLRSIISIPLYLRALGAFGSSDKLPETKEEILRNFVTSHDNHPDHHDPLQTGLKHCHTGYLKEIASRMVSQGVVALSESELRTLVTDISSALADDGQFKREEAPDSNAALETLVAHHILMSLGEQDGERLFGFQHQQFPEWYASFGVEALMIAVHEKRTEQNMRELDGLFNRTDIRETIQFAMERLSRRSDFGNAAGTATLRALRIDLQTAAALVGHLPEKIWQTIKAEVIDYAKNLLGGDQHDRIIRFMGTTGKPDFADYIWAELADSKRYDQHTHRDRSWLRPNSLGPDGMKRLVASPFDLRRAMLWDFVIFGDEEGIAFANSYAPMEPEPDLVADIVHNIEFNGSEEEAARLLDQLTPDAWQAVAQKGRVTDLPPKYRAKAIELKKQRASTLTGHDRYFALVELAQAGEEMDGREIVALALESSFKEMHSEYSALEFLNERFPGELKEEIARRTAAGEKLPSYANRYAVPADHRLQKDVLERALSGKDARPMDVRATAKSLDQESVATVLRQYIVVGSQAWGPTTPESRAAYEHRSKLQGILTSVQLDLIINALTAYRPKSGRDVSELAEIVSRWQDEDRDADKLPASPEQIARLTDALLEWGRILEADSEGQRANASHLVSAVKRVGGQRLFPLFVKLMNIELAEEAKDREYREQWHADGRKPEPIRHMVGYGPIYRQALAPFTGDQVRDFLISVLDDPGFGIDAAFELRRFGTARELDKPGQFVGTRSKYDRLREARSNRAKTQPPTSVVAGELFKRIESLLNSGTDADRTRAAALATAAVQMDYGNHFPLVVAAIEAQPRPKNSYALLEVISSLGLPLEAPWVRRGFDDELAEYNKAKWHNQNDFWVLRRWIELLALSTNPEEVIEAIKALPSEPRRAHNFHEVIYALGHSEAKNATTALIKLADFLPDVAARHDFLNALALQDTEEGAHFLLSIFGQPEKFRNGRPDHGFVETLTRLIIRHPNAKARYLAALVASHDQARVRLASILPGVLQPDDVMPLLEKVVGDSDPLSTGLIQASTGLAVRRKYADDRSSFEMQPQDLGRIRGPMLGIALGKSECAGTAYRMLMEIENAREEYGRPATEPHHPDISTGVPWPLDLKKFPRK